MDVPLWVWAAVVGGIVIALLVDLLVFHRHAHEVTMREAALTSAFWIAVGVAFGVGVWLVAGGERGGEYFAGYLIEKALAVDNIFVFAVILGAFAIPAAQQHRLLFYGVLGALVLRGGFIAAGTSLLDAFSWVMYLFGAFLILTGIRLARDKGHDVDPTKNPVLRLLQRRFALSSFGLALIAIETTDVVFALDSIPAIFAVSNEPFIVFTSNAFAILGLRALYFLLAGAIHRFRYLGKGLAAVLVFVGLKMLAIDLVKVPIALSLGVIVGILAISVGVSLRAEPAGPAERAEVRA